MALTVYATVEDLTGAEPPWVLTAPDDVERFLRAASFVVAEACNRNPYNDAPAGDTATALRDATCAQAASWIAVGVDPDTLGVGGPQPVRRSKILSGEVEYDTTAAKAAVRSLAQGDLAPQAETILTAAGLLWVPVPVGDTCGFLPTYGLSAGNPRGPYWPDSRAIDAGFWPFQ